MVVLSLESEILIVDIKGEPGVEPTGGENGPAILELSARGMSILQGFACIDGAQELSDELNRMRFGTSDGLAKDLSKLGSFWLKI